FGDAKYYKQNHYDPLYIYKSGPSGPDFVMIISPYNSAQDQATVYAIKSPLRVANSKPTGPWYTSIMIKNPNGSGEVVDVARLQAGNALARSAPHLGGDRGSTALQTAGTTNKDGELLPN